VQNNEQKYFLHMKKLSKYTLILVWLLTSIFSFAGTEPLNVRMNAASMLAGYSIGIQDNKYPNVEVAGQSVVKSSVGQIILGIDQSILNNGFTKFTLQVNVKITAFDKTGNIIPTPASTPLEVKYSKTLGQEFKDRDIYVIKNCHKISAKILSVTYIDQNNVTTINPSNVPGIVYMEADMNTERYYSFNTAFPYASSLIQKVPITCTSCMFSPYELEINWPVIDGAEEYDLEWSYINNYNGNDATSPISLTNVKYSFKENATRVTVNQNYYRISLLYEKGYIIYRLRGRGRDLTNTDVIVYGDWNSCNVSPLPCDEGFLSNYINPNSYLINAHDDLKNWQSSTTFAEEGKKKEVVSYFDGSLHSRQSLTKINTNDEIMVAENLYDFQGRPAVNILPVPIGQKEFGYRDKFNLKTATNIFDKNEFDVDGTDSCSAPVSVPMDPSSGASNYYSPYNPNKNEQQAYVPDAQGYPYTQVEYTPDKTGRIRRQSGVGPDHQLGSTHETKYFYGQPEQPELDQMFGSEAGNALHYKKNMVIDPNGQISNTYIDMYGKTVATSLAGIPPANLDPLPATPKIMKVKYIYPNVDPNPNAKVGNNSIVFTKDLLVSTAGDYDFTYEVDKEHYQITCPSGQMCYNCVYKLTIKVLDACGLEVPPVTPLDPSNPTANNVRFGTLDTVGFVCNPVVKFSFGPTPPYRVNLGVGNYKIVKELTVDDRIAEIYTDQYIKKSTCLKTVSQFTADAIAKIDLSGCHTDCADCLTSLGLYSAHNDQTKTDPNNSNYDPDYVYMTQDQYDDAKEECEEACKPITECDVMYQLMLADVSPSGQYAQYSVLSTGAFDASTFPLSVLNTDISLNKLPLTANLNSTTNNCGTQLHPQVNATWKNPRITIGATTFLEYRDEDGNPARVYLDKTGPTTFLPDYDNVALPLGPTYDPVLQQYYVAPQHLKYLKDFVDAFANNPSWARSLVEFHPEWRYYALCFKLQDETYCKKSGRTSEQFDSELRNTETFNDAVTAGFIGTLNDPLSLYSIDPAFNNDINSNNPLGSNFSANTHFQNEILNNYKGSGNDIKKIAMSIVRCGNVFYGSTTACEGSGFGDGSYFVGSSQDATAVLDKEWRMYRDLYLGEKQKLLKNVINRFAKGSFVASSFANFPYFAEDDGFYNGPIGIGNEYYNAWEHDMMVAGTYNPFWWWNFTFPGSNLNPSFFLQLTAPRCYGFGSYDPAQPSYYNNWPYYTNKTKRFLTADEILPPGMSLNSYNTADQIKMKNAAEFNTYQSTGQCPMALHLETFLDEMAENGHLAGGAMPLVLNDFFLKDMYNTLVNQTTSFVNLTWNPTPIVTDVLTGKFIGKTAGLDLTLTYVGTGFNDWAKIKYFSDITYMGQTPPGTYNFKIKAYVDTDNNPLTAPDEKQFLGTTSFPIGGCSFVDYCEPSQTASQLLALINTLHNNETVAGTKDLISGNAVTISGTGAPYAQVLTNKLKKPFGVPFAGTLTWQKTSQSATQIIADMVGTTPPLTASFKFDFTALTTNVPAYGYSNIQFFKTITPLAANQNKFVLDAFVGLNTSNEPVFLPVEVTITPPSSSPLYNLGKCGPPPTAACQSPQNQTLEDMGALFDELKSNVVPATNLDLSYYDNYSSLLQSYVGAPNNNTWNSVIVSNTVVALIGTGPTACTLKMWPARLPSTLPSYVNYANITRFSDIHADNSQISNGAYTGNFYITATFGISNPSDTIRYHVNTSCFQFKNCYECTASNQPYVVETFDDLNPSTTTPPSFYTANNTNPLTYAGTQNCVLPSNQFAFLNETDVPSACNSCMDALTGYKDHSQTGNKNYMHVNFDVASNFAYKDIWSYYNASSTSNLINVSPNTTYEFSYWYRVCPPVVKIQLLGIINNATLNTTVFDNSDGKADGLWHQASVFWNSGNATQADLDIVLSNSDFSNSWSGYFDLDEIVFKEKPCTPFNHTNPDPADSIATWEPCDTMLTAIGMANALYNYEQYINDQKRDFKKAYLEKCLSTFETFSVTYTDRQHHYTLYYYDQAGNLIKTIPPAGVELLDLDAFVPNSTTVKYGDAIEVDRNGNTQTVFTNHRMPTTYEYNSLNQLIKQSVPDHDAMNNFQVTNTINNQVPTLPANVVVNGMDMNGPKGFIVGTDGTNNANNGVIYATNDGGVTWAPISSVGFNNLNKVQDAGNSTIYAVADGGAVVKSVDNGTTWNLVSLIPATNFKVNDLYFFSDQLGFIVGDNNLAYKTTNGGASWTSLNVVSGNINLNAIHFTNSANGYIVGNNGTLLYTTNGGNTWLSPSVPLNTNLNLTGVQFYPPVSTPLTTSGNDDLISGFITGYDNNTTNGKTIFVRNLKSIQYQSPSTNILNTVGYSGVVFNNSSTPAKQLNALTIYDAGTQNVYTDDKILNGGKNGELYNLQYNSSSLQWNGTLETLPANFSSEITDVVYPNSGNQTIAYATAKNGAILSYNNSSNNWVNISSNNNTTPLNGIYFSQPYSSSSNVFAVGNGGAILKSINGGANFSNATQASFQQLNDVSIAKDNSGLVVAVGNNGFLLRSTNNGASWTSLNSTTSNHLYSVWSMDNTNTIFAGQAGGIFALSGAVASGITSPVSTDLNEITFVNNLVGYMAGNNGVVLSTNTGGVNWGITSTPVTNNLKGIHTNGSVIMAVGANGTIVKSINAAAFTDITPTAFTQNLNQVKVIDNQLAYAFGANGLVLKTTNGGANWTQAASQPGISYNAVSFTSNGNMLIGGSGSTNLFQANVINGDHSQKFWFDRLGRVIISQNSKQFSKSIPAYSYTKYDKSGRVIEVGENATLTDPQTLTNYNNLIPENIYNTWLNAGSKAEVIFTVFDNPVSSQLVQKNLRDRVSATYRDNNDNINDGYVSATYYSYDMHGNVDDMLQDNPLMPFGQKVKETRFDYDLISGKVNQIKYQDDQPDAFYHKYYYDADNRLSNVYTSRNKVLWEQDVKYFYYKHELLARTEIGDEKVQGIDYAYTLHGWIKDVNSSTMSGNRDIGKDGAVTSINPLLAYNNNHADINRFVSRDAYGYALHYYNNDYKAISNNPANPTALHKYDANNRSDANPLANVFFNTPNNELFNGNIMGMQTAIPSYASNTFNYNANTQLTTYKYDQLNRVKDVNAYDANFVVPNNAWGANSSIPNLYKNAFTYDANGNIMTQDRFDQNGAQFDEFQYQYELDANNDLRKNRLYHVNDNPSTSFMYLDDINDQATFTPASSSNPNIINTANNYGYDALGNLARDNQEEIANIDWTVDGKIKTITRSSGSTKVDLEFIYDSFGNRIAKIVKPRSGGNPSSPTAWIYTYYERDGSGNILAIYSEDKPTNKYNVSEFTIYGSSREGLLNNNSTNYSSLINIAASQYQFNRNKGNKNYELSNHLENVVAAVSDRRTAVDVGSNNTTDYYDAEILSTTDYYAFGTPMPGRTFISSTNYRYGFNGKENDNEVKGMGNQQDYGLRIYDGRLGKFLSVDPLTSSYPSLSPYPFAMNRPIDGIDLDGAEWEATKDKEGNTVDYTWRGYNEDGSPKENTVPGGEITNGVLTITFSSNKESQMGYVRAKGMAPFLDYLGFETINQVNIDNTVTFSNDAAVWGQTGKQASLSDEIEGEFVGASGYAIARMTFYKELPLASGRLEGWYPETYFIPVERGLSFGFKALEGASAKIIGSAQFTGTWGHAAFSKALAWRFALDPRVEKVTLDLGLKKLGISGAFKWGIRPDIGVKYFSGKFTAIEVVSHSQSKAFLKEKLADFGLKWGVELEKKVYYPFFLGKAFKKLK
jgi:RHS repeat-associated protein